MILPSQSLPFVPLPVGRGDQVQARVDVVLDLVNKRLSVNGHDGTARARGELHRPRSPRSGQPQVRGVHHVRSDELGNGQADCTTKVSHTTHVAKMCSRLVLCVPVGLVETPAGLTFARSGRRRVRARVRLRLP